MMKVSATLVIGAGNPVKAAEMAVDSASLIVIGDKTLALLGGHICKSPEEYKAWSQNLCARRAAESEFTRMPRSSRKIYRTQRAKSDNEL
jgi:hypothetical protein